MSGKLLPGCLALITTEKTKRFKKNKGFTRSQTKEQRLPANTTSDKFLSENHTVIHARKSLATTECVSIPRRGETGKIFFRKKLSQKVSLAKRILGYGHRLRPRPQAKFLSATQAEVSFPRERAGAGSGTRCAWGRGQYTRPGFGG